MTISQPTAWAALMVSVAVLSPTRADAQVNASLTDRDRAEIQDLSTRYRRALFGCMAEEYADLFATPGGYFGSSSRGEVRERQALMEMVLSYERCDSAPAAASGAPQAPGSAPVIEPAPEGARARILYGSGPGYYDDVYVRTPTGWRFKSRNVVADSEAAAQLTTQDFIEIRQLAGDDHGHYENVYGEHDDFSPRGMTEGADHRPFRASGLRLTPTPEGVRGTAYLRNNGGRYDDRYVRTRDGWRIQQRVHVPPADVP